MQTNESEWLNRGLAAHQAGRWAEAERAYHKVLELVPQHPDALHRLGILASQQGDHQRGIEWIRRALVQQPLDPQAYYNLAMVLVQLEKWEEAILSLKQSLQLQEDYVEAHAELGQLLAKTGRKSEAIDSYLKAVKLQPDNPIALWGLAEALESIFRWDDAIRCYRRIIELDPQQVAARNNLANIHKLKGELREAGQLYHAAIQLRPDLPILYLNLANILVLMEQPEAAASYYRQALHLAPDHVDALIGLGDVLQSIGEFEEASQCMERALSLDPSLNGVAAMLVHRMQADCRWEGLDRWTDQVIRAVAEGETQDNQRVIPPFIFIGLSRPTSPWLQLRCGQRISQRLQRAAGFPPPLWQAAGDSAPHRPWRIGYLSGDFRLHPVALLIAELLEEHDREQFQIHAYSYGIDDQSPIRQRIARGVDRFVDIRHLSFEAAAQRIAADGIDFLIDLQGYTGNSRPEILVYRPAPIQLQYLGFSGTMGAEFIDYVIADEQVAPLEHQPFYSERLLHVPGCFMVQDSHREIEERPLTRHEVGLPADAFVFCGFSAAYKLNATMFQVWMDLLREVEGSVLWLRIDQGAVRDQLRRFARRASVDERRLIFAEQAPMPLHLARHRMADLFLDTFPYNQHSTAADALRLGLPLLTLSGETFASRVAMSLLHHLGLDELVTRDVDAYRKQALAVARQPAYLASLRHRLAETLKTTDLYQGRQFARKLESLLRQVANSPPR